MPQQPTRARGTGSRGLPLPGAKFFALLLLGLVGFLVWEHRGRPLAEDEADRAVLAVGKVLTRHATGFAPDPDLEFMEKRLLWDQTLRYEYSYGAESEEGPRLSILSWVDDGERAARDRFRMLMLKSTLDWDLGSGLPVGLVELDLAGDWGDESRVYRVELHGKSLGTSASARLGNRVVHASLRGVDLDRDTLRRSFVDLLAKLERCRKPETSLQRFLSASAGWLGG